MIDVFIFIKQVNWDKKAYWLLILFCSIEYRKGSSIQINKIMKS